MGCPLVLILDMTVTMTCLYCNRSASAVFFTTVRATSLLLMLLLGACSTLPPKDQSVSSSPAQQKPAVRTEPVRPKIALSEEILYKILVAEFAGQRGRLDISVDTYLDLAVQTRDPKIVERATRIAVYARNAEAATEAARLWLELDPLNPDAHQVLAVMALRKGNIDEAMQHLQNILQNSHDQLDQKLWMIVNLLGREKDKELVMNVMERLIAMHEDDTDAVYAFANIAARLGELDRAEELFERVIEMAPDNDNAAMNYISILQRQGNVHGAIKWLEQALPKRANNDFNLRMAYARLLTDTSRFDKARRQFEILTVSAPNNTDVLYALGLLYLQDNRLDESESYFKRLSALNIQADNASYYLGRIAEERKQYEKAMTWFQGVNKGENLFEAQIRIGLLMAKTGDMDAARNHLKTVTANNTQERTTLIQAEGELLIENKHYDKAMAVFDGALQTGYNADLLYSRAMLAEKMGHIDILERDLREIIDREPDHAQALNALGYSLTDRTNRHQEELALIQHALSLNPNDFFTLDSMGWVLYRLGRHEEAIDYLRRAMSIRQDPEIAAHLGEVLWVIGDKKGAKEIWETALQVTPEDSHILDTIKRFKR